MTDAATFNYRDGDTECHGFIYRPDSDASSHPVVLVCPAWDGLVQEVHDKAKKLSEEGYIAVGVDVLGGGQTLVDFADLQPALDPFLSDRAMLLQRLQAAVSAARDIEGADPSRLGVVGYCFGGLCALDLARSGSGIRAAVSLHGGLTTNGLGDIPIEAQVLVLHGHDDPMVPPEQVAEFQREMTARGADWQLVSYGNTLHSFTRADANAPEMGIAYNALTDRRSWRAMCNFLEETLKA